jgi:hypothetical protein
MWSAAAAAAAKPLERIEIMDQSEMLTLLGGLYDKLVSDVAQRVQTELAGKVTEGASAAIEGLKGDLDSRINACIEDWADNHLDDRLDTWATVHLDIDGDIDRYVRNDLDIADLVKDAVQDLTFEVTVS